MKSLFRAQAALARAWSAETAYKGDWSAENPARNQCAVTALVVQDHFGGAIVRGAYMTPSGEKGTHYWNRIAGVDLDFTANQFPAGTQVECLTRDYPRESLLSNPNTAARYAILRDRVRMALSS